MTNDLFSAPVRFAAPILLAVALAQVATPQDRTNDVQAVPAFKESRHHLVFENEWVRVMDVRVPARDTTDYHVHADRHVGVVIATARTWEQRLGEAASAPEDTDHVGDGLYLDGVLTETPAPPVAVAGRGRSLLLAAGDRLWLANR